jgi:murein L,D-transpeptidase YafK
MSIDRALFRKLAFVVVAGGVLAACGDMSTSSMRGAVPIPAKLLAEMKGKGMTRSSPILVRVYKQESELEIWKKTSSGHFALLKTYPVCRWSGQLGPKNNEGDRQVPEGFYSISAGQLNPSSNYYLSFDVGYPNAYDRQFGRSGGDIMVHGSCSSRGCFAMTDQEMGEIYAVAREALQAGQGSFQLQSYPFRMTAQNLARNRRNPNIGFWKDLKKGSDNFEVTKQPVEVASCGNHYVFNGQGGESCRVTLPDPSVVAAVVEKERHDETEIAALVSSGTPAVNYLYEDGSSNPVFTARAVDSHAIPGKDRPYTTVRAPTMVSLNDSGAPATEADARAAAKATYSAAETLLMAEAVLARRPVGPQNPKAIAGRQQTVYARLMGNKMPIEPEKPAEKPALAKVVVASAEPVASKPAAAAAGAADDKPFYRRWLGFASEEEKPAPTAAIAAAAPVSTAVPTQPVEASTAGASEKPFYKRWFGFGTDEKDASEVPTALDAPPATGSVPLPPSRPRYSFTSLD